MEDAYLTTKEVARLLKINVDTVYDLVARNEIPATKIGTQWRFETQEIREWFRARREQPAAQRIE